MIDRQPDFQMLTTEHGSVFFHPAVMFWVLIQQVF